MSATDAAVVALAGEQAAVYAYGVIAAHLSGSDEKRALAAMAAHRANRDLLLSRLESAGATPSPAAAAYTLPSPVVDPASARALAGLVEDRLAGQWAALAAASDGEQRRSAALVAQATAVRGVSWTGVAPVWSGAV
jgi:hypothetical protein